MSLPRTVAILARMREKSAILAAEQAAREMVRQQEAAAKAMEAISRMEPAFLNRQVSCRGRMKKERRCK